MKIFLSLILLTLVSCGKESSSPKSETHQQAMKPKNYLSLVNQHRQELGLNPFKYSLIIEEVAETHTQNMASGDVRFGHDGFKSRCARLRVELGASGCGEIVARGQKDEEAVLKAWLNSNSHRKSIEKPDYNYTGYAREIGVDGRIYWVQFFLTIK